MLPRRSFLQSLCSLVVVPWLGRAVAAKAYRVPATIVSIVNGYPQPYNYGAASAIAGEAIEAGQMVAFNEAGRVVPLDDRPQCLKDFDAVIKQLKLDQPRRLGRPSQFAGIANEPAGDGQPISVFGEGIIDIPEDSVDRGDYWA